MAVGNSGPEYDLSLGDGKDKPGLFVIISQTRHQMYFPTMETYWGADKAVLDYEFDVKRILNIFGLKETDGKKPQSDNLVLKRDLTNKDGDQPFEKFRKELLARTTKPSFIMVFVLSHGFAGGKFLLSNSKTDKFILDPCCGGNKTDVKDHRAEGKCFVRDLFKDLIKPISDWELCKGIPKLFVIQTCRGSEPLVVRQRPPKSDGSDGEEHEEQESEGEEDAMRAQAKRENRTKKPDQEPAYNDLFVSPEHPDVFLFRACLEGTMSWGTKSRTDKKPKADEEKKKQAESKGSFFIRSFCHEVHEVDVAKGQWEALRSVIDERGTADESLAQKVEEVKTMLNGYRHEVLRNGWLTDICLRTAAAVSNNMVTLGDQSNDKQQPHISSTFSKQLSIVRILDTQRAGTADQP